MSPFKRQIESVALSWTSVLNGNRLGLLVWEWWRQARRQGNSPLDCLLKLALVSLRQALGRLQELLC
jgi:hypothetical protein